MAAFPLPFGHMSQGSESAATPDHDLRPVREAANAFPYPAIDLLPHELPVLVSERVGPHQTLGHPDRTQRQRMNLVDDRTRGEDDLHTPAADVYHRRRSSVQGEMPSGAPERELSLLLGGDY